MKDNQKVLLSLIVGAAAGVAAGILLAPASGKDSRRKITDRANSLSNDFSKQLGVSLEKLTDLRNTVISTINDLSGKASDKVNQAANFATDKAREAGERAGVNVPTNPR